MNKVLVTPERDEYFRGQMRDLIAKGKVVKVDPVGSKLSIPKRFDYVEFTQVTSGRNLLDTKDWQKASITIYADFYQYYIRENIDPDLLNWAADQCDAFDALYSWQNDYGMLSNVSLRPFDEPEPVEVPLMKA